MSNEVSGSREEEPFSFKIADLVLVKWGDGMVYFAKIKKIDYKRSKCIVVFDDKSQDEAGFDQIHSVDETTTDIICIKCKRDDSDAPNEIVLCDTCGIGFHQRCHVPPIPASALELDMPWNCTYCQKGSKCPFLTESLDVLQNLLLDDDKSRDGDEESVVTIDSDQDEYGTTKSVRYKKRKGRRAAGARRKKGFHKGQSPEKVAPKISPPSADVWRHKLASTERSQASSEQKDVESFSEGSPGTTEIAGKKRKKPHSSEGSCKRQKRASVESHTVSVTRLSVPICEESSTSTDQEQSYDTITLSDTEANLPQTKDALPSIVEESKRPRSLRVSLSLPEEVEGESPIGKVVKASQKFKTPEYTQPANLPTWDEIVVTAQQKTSPVISPSQGGPLTSTPTAVLSPPGIGSTVELPTAPLVPKPKGASSVPSPSGVIQLPTSPLLACLPKHSEVVGQKRKLSDPADTSKAPKQHAPSVPSPSFSPSLDDVFEQPAAVVKDQHRDSSPHTVIQLTTPTTESPVGQHIQPYEAAIPKVGPLAPKPEPAKPTFRAMAPKMAPWVPTPEPARPKYRPIAPKMETPVITKVVARVVTPHISHSTPSSSVVAMTASPIPKPAATTVASPPGGVTVSGLVPRSTTTPVSRAPSIAKTATTPLHQTTLASPHGVITSVKCNVVTSDPSFQPPDKAATLATTPSQSVTPEFTQGKSTTAVTTTTTPATTKKQSQPKPHLIKNGSEVSPQRSQNKQTSPSRHTPLQSLVSNAMNTALASAIATINDGNSPEPEVPPQAMTRPTPITIIAKPADSPDVIITGFETKLKSTPEVKRPPPPPTQAVPMQTHSRQQQRPQDLYHGRPKTISDPKPKKVIAKTVEIQSLPPSSQSPVPTQSASQAAGAIVTPIASQTPVSVVQAVVVAPPPAYSQPAQDGSQTYYIPPVSQEGQHVLYAVPASTATGSSVVAVPQAMRPQLHRIIQEPAHKAPPPPYRPPLTATTVITTPTTVDNSHLELPPYTVPVQRAAVSPQVKQQTNVVYYTTGGVASSGRGTPVNTTKPYAIVAALPTAADSATIGGIEYRIPVSQQTGDIQYVTTQAAQILSQHPEKFAQGQDITYAYSYKKPSSVLLKTPTVPTPRPSVTPQSQENGRDDDVAGHLQAISKKIGAAFAQFSEEMLLGAFEDAWKKFQANGRKYEALSKLEGSAIMSSPSPSASIKANFPPNAEVISTPGISPKLSLVRPTHSKPKPIAPKPSILTATPTAVTPQAVASTPSGQQQYIYTYPANATQPQVIIQPVNSEYAIYTAAVAPKPKTYQVQTSGLYYPTTASDSGSKVDMANAVITSKQVVNTHPAPQQIPKASPQRIVTARPTATTPVQHQPSRRTSNLPRRRGSSKSIRLCALCGKEATYLCSGCHAEWYCGRDCQLKAWDKHSDHCKA